MPTTICDRLTSALCGIHSARRNVEKLIHHTVTAAVLAEAESTLRHAADELRYALGEIGQPVDDEGLPL